MIRPRIRYPGGKSRIAPWLVSHFPEIKVKWERKGFISIPATITRFCEPFAGRGNVYFYYRWECLYSRRKEFAGYQLNDIKTYKLFSLLMNSSESDIKELIGYPNIGREGYEYLRYHRNTPKAIILEPYCTFSGGGWDMSFSTRESMGKAGNGSCGVKPETYIEYMISASRILKSNPVTEITADDAVETIINSDENDFLYVDPPYPGANPGAYEANDMQLHVRTCRALQVTKAHWLCSNYDREPYSSMLGKPFARKMTTQVMSPAMLGSERSVREECLWKNY